MSNQSENCIFCKISKKEIPYNNGVFENKNFVVLLDIKPVSTGHLVIFPRKHVIWMQEAEDKVVGDIFKLTKKMMLALKKGLGCDYIQVSVVGNEVPHFHVHLIPRYKGDHFRNFPTKKFEPTEAQKTIAKIKKSI